MRTYPAWPTEIVSEQADVRMAPAGPFPLVSLAYTSLLTPPSVHFTLVDRPGRCSSEVTQKRSQECTEQYRLCFPHKESNPRWLSEHDHGYLFETEACAWFVNDHLEGAPGEVSLTSVEQVREAFEDLMTDGVDFPGEDDAPWMCLDGVDNDGDGRVDCGDLECLQTPVCAHERDFGLSHKLSLIHI